MAGILTWKSRFGGAFGNKSEQPDASEEEHVGPPKWSMGVLNDLKTIEVPGKPNSVPCPQKNLKVY